MSSSISTSSSFSSTVYLSGLIPSFASPALLSCSSPAPMFSRDLSESPGVFCSSWVFLNCFLCFIRRFWNQVFTCVNGFRKERRYKLFWHIILFRLQGHLRSRFSWFIPVFLRGWVLWPAPRALVLRDTAAFQSAFPVRRAESPRKRCALSDAGNASRAIPGDAGTTMASAPLYERETFEMNKTKCKYSHKTV